MVGYVFSDKTGTLTCNVMSFKKFTAGQRGYGTSKKSLIDYKSKGITNVNFDDQLAFDEMNNRNSANWLSLDRFFRNLAVCHTVIVQEDRLGAMSYNAASPDELALVNGAKLFGYSFQKRDEDSNVIIELKDGSTERYELLCVLEFTSDRKRMTVVARDP